MRGLVSIKWGLLFYVLFLGVIASNIFLYAEASNQISRLEASPSVFRATLNHAELDEFYVGRSFFRQPWVSAPATTTLRDGLGPLFNGISCESCHREQGRGTLPDSETESLVSAVVTLGMDIDNPDQRKQIREVGFLPDLTYGDQLQTKAIQGLKPEAEVFIRYENITGVFADGEEYTLQKPEIIIRKKGYGDFNKNTRLSLRVAPSLRGSGLLDLVDEQQIYQMADPDDANEDGISGRVNKVWDIKKQRQVVGRFGWRAAQPTLAQQVSRAFHSDLGLTNSYYSHPTCTSKQIECLESPQGGFPEISDSILDKVVFYTSNIALPSKLKPSNQDEVDKGQRLFEKAGCGGCHVSTLYIEETGQSIQPYSDLLLHDMGEELSAQRTEFDANHREWRTAPLWGIAYDEKSREVRYLHDGRARNLLEAILWHGGEAEAAKQKVLRMNKQQRSQLLGFVHSL